MALGITNHVWSIGELLDAALAVAPSEPTQTMPDRRCFGALLLLSDVLPQLVQLQTAGADAYHAAIVQLGAAAPDAERQAQVSR
jgi:hypothetical protein